MDEELLRLSCLNAAINAFKDYGHDTPEILLTAAAFYKFVKQPEVGVLEQIKEFITVYDRNTEINGNESAEENYKIYQPHSEQTNFS